MTADDTYDEALDIIDRKMKGDTSVTDEQYQVAKDIMSSVFIAIRYDREGTFPSHIDKES